MLVTTLKDVVDIAKTGENQGAIHLSSFIAKLNLIRLYKGIKISCHLPKR